MDYYVRVRSPALGISLSDSSMHHPGVHNTWPLARTSCIRKRCSTIHAGNLAVQKSVDKLSNHCPSHVALGNLGSSLGTFRCPKKCKPSSWLILPYHPLWGNGGLPAKLKAIFRRWQCLWPVTMNVSRICAFLLLGLTTIGTSKAEFWFLTELLFRAVGRGLWRQLVVWFRTSYESSPSHQA